MKRKVSTKGKEGQNNKRSIDDQTMVWSRSFSGEHIDDHTQAADPFMLSSGVLLGSIGPTGTS